MFTRKVAKSQEPSYLLRTRGNDGEFSVGEGGFLGQFGGGGTSGEGVGILKTVGRWGGGHNQ